MRINHGREAGAASEQRGPTFTGEVWADPVLQGAPGVTVNDVFFPSGGRTYWHRHERGQILFVTQGRGYVRVRDGEGSHVSPGDVVFFEPGEVHWHGAAADSYLLHRAVSLGETEWLEEVPEEEYRADVEAS